MEKGYDMLQRKIPKQDNSQAFNWKHEFTQQLSYDGYVEMWARCCVSPHQLGQ